jgi:excisionase family DNA binding protein
VPKPSTDQLPTDRFLKLREVQTMLGVSRTTLWRWHAERGLKVVTIGGVTRIRQSDLDAFLRKHEAGQGTAGL